MSTTVRHDFYQTVEKVVVNILLKKADELNCKVTIESNRLLIEADGDIRLEFHLCESINAEKSSFKIGSVKVEVTLMKLVGGHWADLTKEKAETKPGKVQIYRKDWGKIEKSMQDETEGYRTENDVFSELYKNAPPDAQRAMKKSIVESNGTVLNMNWAEVGSKKTETKPPEGTDFVPWNGSRSL